MQNETKYLLIQHSDCCCGNCPVTIEAYPTSDQREAATAVLLNGGPIDNDEEKAAVMHQIQTLREDGKLSFEGDPPIQWMDANYSEVDLDKLEAPSVPTCPGCGGPLETVTYPGGYLNREQWDSQKAGDYVCKVCPDNGRAANKQHAYFWEKELTAQKEENNPALPPSVGSGEGSSPTDTRDA